MNPTLGSSSVDSIVEDGLQFFNEAVLGTLGSELTTILLPAPEGAWSPSQISLELEDTLCYGALVHYPKNHSFEHLRAAINYRFKQWQLPDLIVESRMGIWRNDDAGFTIQLGEDEDCFVVIYTRFAEVEIVHRKFIEAVEQHPELLSQLFQD